MFRLLQVFFPLLLQILVNRAFECRLVDLYAALLVLERLQQELFDLFRFHDASLDWTGGVRANDVPGRAPVAGNSHSALRIGSSTRSRQPRISTGLLTAAP